MVLAHNPEENSMPTTATALYLADEGGQAQRQARFLAAWKRGVQLAGESCFDITAISVDRATDKDQLRPRWDHVEETLLHRSRGDAAFLAALCTFFNSHWGQALLERAGAPNLRDLAVTLDAERAAVIAELFRTYPGW
jgi:hypothetical protein